MNFKPYLFVLLLVSGATRAGEEVVCGECAQDTVPVRTQTAPSADASSVDESKKVVNRAAQGIIPNFPNNVKTSNGLIEFVTPVLVSKSKSCS